METERQEDEGTIAAAAEPSNPAIEQKSIAINETEATKTRSLSVKDVLEKASFLDSEKVPLPIEATKSQWAVLRIIQGRWIRIFIFFLACLFTSAIYYGWQQYAQLLIKSGAYSWLCAEDDPECDAQSKAVGRLYSIAAGFEYASAALGGLMLDHMGPRNTAIVGEVTWIIGTILLAISSESVRLHILAMIIIGSSVNIVCFPSLCTIETFPKCQGLMVGIVLSAQNAATAIPVILLKLWNTHENWTFRGIWLIYCAAIALPVALLYICALPGKRDFNKILEIQRIEVLALQEKRKEVDDTTDDVTKMIATANTDLKGDVSTVKSPSITSSMEGKIKEDQHEGTIVRIQPKSASWTDFFSNLCTLDMMLMAPWFCIMMMMYAYYATVVRDAIGDQISDFVAYFMPSQAVWALLVGFLCDKFRTGWVMIFMCLCLCLVYGLSLKPESLVSSYIAACILIISQCAIFEVKYTYIGEMFDPYNYGKLVGCLGVIGGIGTFLNIPVASGSNYRAVFLAYVIILPFMAMIAYFLLWRQKRGITHKTLPEEAPQEIPIVDNPV